MTATPPQPHVGERRRASTRARLQALLNDDTVLPADAYRLAFADPEFLLRRETRGLRLQLEMLKPDLALLEHGITHTVVVFGSARFCSPEEAQSRLAAAELAGDDAALARARRDVRNATYYEQARAFARLVAEDNQDRDLVDRMTICTGGGPGIMEAANRGAHDAGAVSVGLNIVLPHEQFPNPYITPELCFKFHYFALRKMHFMMRAKALVAFPGGFGTLDELFEIITLVQTGKVARVPVILYGTPYWERLLNLQHMVDEGVIAADDLELFQHADSPQDAWDQIRAFYQL